MAAGRKIRRRGGPLSPIVPMVTRCRGRGAIAPVEDCPSPIFIGKRLEEESIEASRSALMEDLEVRFSDLVKSISDMDGSEDSGLKKALDAIPINLELDLNATFVEGVVEDLGSDEDTDSTDGEEEPARVSFLSREDAAEVVVPKLWR